MALQGGAGAGGKGLPASPVLCQGQSWGPNGGAWPGRGRAAADKSLDRPGDQDRAAPSQPGSGVAWREIRGWVQCEAGRWARLKREGQVTWASTGPGRGSREAAAGTGGLQDGGHGFGCGAPRTAPGARRASPGGCAARPPVRGAGSPRRAGAAGRWGPGRPCWASAPHPGRAGGRAWRGRPGPASAWSLARPPRPASSQRPSYTRRSPRTPRLHGRGGSGGAGGGEGGPGAGLRRGGAGRRTARPSPPAAMATAAGPACAEVWRPRCPASVARTRAREKPGAASAERGSAEGGPEGGAWRRLRPRPAGGAAAQRRPRLAGPAGEGGGPGVGRLGEGRGLGPRDVRAQRAAFLLRVGYRISPAVLLAPSPFLPLPASRPPTPATV